MKRIQWLAVIMAVAVVGMLCGCGGDDDGGSDGSYAGTWTGKVCGRDLTLHLRQNGSAFTGDYTLSGVGGNPDFTEVIVNGTVSSLTPPATATLNGLDTRQFSITFNSYDSFTGTFYNSGAACATSATK